MSLSKGEEAEPPLKFMKSKDEITVGEDSFLRALGRQQPQLEASGDEYDGTQRVQMSCGHAVDPGNLTAGCSSLIDEGCFSLYCPADVNGAKCGAEWPYPEVRHSAALGDKEQRDFERKLALSAARRYCDFKECPRCRSLVERKELTHLRVLCTICSSSLGGPYEFCWQCLRAWKGQGTPSDHCANEGRRDASLHVLATCGTKDLPGSEIRGCPSIQACPTCGLLIEHKGKCKLIELDNALFSNLKMVFLSSLKLNPRADAPWAGAPRGTPAGLSEGWEQLEPRPASTPPAPAQGGTWV